jgi:hypothetical protein
MNWRKMLTKILAALTLGALVATKILWAVTAWYEWGALAVCAVCVLALKLVPEVKSGQDEPSKDDPI